MAIHWLLIAVIGPLIVIECLYQSKAFLSRNDKRR